MMMGPRKCKVSDLAADCSALKYCRVVGLSFLLGLDFGLWTQCSGPLRCYALVC